MVVDSGMPPEELNDLMGLIYDKVAVGLEGIGVEDEEDADDYRRTTMGFMEALKKATVNILVEKEIITGGEYATDAAALRQTDAELDEKKQPSEKSAKKAHKALKKTAKKKFPKDKERQDRYIYGGKRKMGWKPKRERK
jgi:hypothetical protein